ncbi:MAG: MarR family transcriptional regulator [Acidimicrobiia bacterium]|nr:MarR family transcriptional regulator [Acidimicrobiia bacterium]MDH5291552.1 MarR family transcriptional regulator [Acidimicrobiia bacterium]
MSTDLPAYVLDSSPLAVFTRLQRVGLHLEALQGEAMAEIGLSFADYTILATLHREPAPHRLSVSRLAELVLRPMGSITQAVDRVEDAGLVRRVLDPDDRRRVLIELTAGGLDLATRGDAAYRVVRERVLHAVPADERDAVDRAVSALLEALEQNRSPG